MDTYRLKNVIIIILVLVNLSLLGALGIWSTSGRAADRQAAEQMVALFARDGIALDADRISSKTPPESRVLQRETALDASLAEALLGESLQASDMGGGLYLYSGDSGEIQFRTGGGFSATCALDTGGNPEAFCRALCQRFHYRDMVAQLEDGTGILTGIQYFDGLPVLNCTITFTVQDAVIRAVEGSCIPDSYVSLNREEPVSAMTALSIFLEERRATGAVVTEVREVSLCYLLESSAASPMTLEPAWRIVTDTVDYRVNCVTGAISHS